MYIYIYIYTHTHTHNLGYVEVLSQNAMNSWQFCSFDVQRELRHPSIEAHK